jgi:hypothetical protein
MDQVSLFSQYTALLSYTLAPTPSRFSGRLSSSQTQHPETRQQVLGRTTLILSLIRPGLHKKRNLQQFFVAAGMCLPRKIDLSVKFRCPSPASGLLNIYNQEFCSPLEMGPPLRRGRGPVFLCSIGFRIPGDGRSPKTQQPRIL